MTLPQVYPSASPIGTLPERIWKRIDKNGPLWNGIPCWITNYKPEWNGYVRVWLDGKLQTLHCLTYQMLIGPIPEGMEHDHLCRNRGCCNPAHLESVTSSENCRRSPIHVNALAAQRTHCKNGHELARDNVYTPLGTNARRCRRCHRIEMAKKEGRFNPDDEPKSLDEIRQLRADTLDPLSGEFIRQCNKCGQQKPISQFCRDKHRRNICRICRQVAYAVSRKRMAV